MRLVFLGIINMVFDWGNKVGYEIASQRGGHWISIEESFFSDEECEKLTIRCEIYAEPRNGEYTYYSMREYMKG